MLRTHSILIGIISALVLLVVATLHFPGGSQYDRNATGYDWRNNYLSNLFGERAVNGLDNSARPWAIGGMFFLCVSFALFFSEFSEKIASKSAARIVKYFGISAMLFAFLTVTPYHDTMITIASTLALVSLFYITVFVFRSTLHFFKVLCAVCLLVLYGCNYMYYSRTFLEYLPIMQKVGFAVTTSCILGLAYFTKRDDFQHIR